MLRAASIALSHACVSAMESSSRSTRLSPSWPPSVAATRLATGMKADDAGIFSSARSRFMALRLAFFAVGLPHLARGRRLQLVTLSLRRRDPVLDRLADRMVGVGDHLARPLGNLSGLLHRLAAGQLDRLAPHSVDLAAAWARCDVR